MQKRLAYLYYIKGEFGKAIENYMKAVPIYLESIGENHSHVAVLYNNLGLVYDGKNMLAEAISEFNKALAINPHLAEAHNNLGLIFAQQGRTDKAISHYEEALRLNLNQMSDSSISLILSWFIAIPFVARLTSRLIFRA